MCNLKCEYLYKKKEREILAVLEGVMGSGVGVVQIPSFWCVTHCLLLSFLTLSVNQVCPFPISVWMSHSTNNDYLFCGPYQTVQFLSKHVTPTMIKWFYYEVRKSSKHHFFWPVLRGLSR